FFFFFYYFLSRVEKVIFFFFSSRRRHTRYWRDWSSDVCSSDLPRAAAAARPPPGGVGAVPLAPETPGAGRSEERRVGKECRSRWWRYHSKKKLGADSCAREEHGERLVARRTTANR